MICYNCGCQLSEKNFCTNCGADVGIYKKIMYMANRFYNDGLEKANVRDLSGAVSSLRQCIKLNKNHIEARNLIGLIYYERGEVVAALSEWVISKNIRGEKNIADDYIDMLQNNPGRLDTYNQTIKKYNMALTYCNQDSLDLAVIQLKKVISMNPHFVQARNLLTLLFINNQEWDRAKREAERVLKIDANNTMALRYLKEIEAMLPTDEERPSKRKKEAVVYKSGNDTVIQPVKKKETVGLSMLLNVLIGIAIGAGITWFLVVPEKVQQEQIASNTKLNAVNGQLDAKTAQVNELMSQIDELMSEKDSLSESLTAAQGNGSALEANTDLIEAALLFSSEDSDVMEIADNLELIDAQYLENDATESFKSLYGIIREGIAKKVSKNSYDTGFSAYKAEEYDTAITDLTRSYEYDNENGDALYNLGNAYYKSGDTTSAIEIYEDVIEKFPNTEKARRSQGYIEEIRGG